VRQARQAIDGGVAICRSVQDVSERTLGVGSLRRAPGARARRAPLGETPGKSVAPLTAV